MIHALLMAEDGEELRTLELEVRETVAMTTDDDSQILTCSSPEQLRDSLRKVELQDFSCIDVTGTEGISCAELVRAHHPQTSLLLIVSRTLSPAAYIRPSVRPSSVLFQPIRKEEIKQTLAEFITSSLNKDDGIDGAVFRLETKEGVTRIPYQKICYFEAAMKKVFVRVGRDEYSFYDTLDSLQDTLPEEFVRCHRSYIVNRTQIRRYSGTDSTVMLADGSQIPVSRSYRSSIRDAVK